MDRGHVSQELDRAEALIKEDPAYAQTVLDSLHTAEESLFDEPKYQARYILLNEYAKYRNGIDEKNDSLISIAVEYYKQNDRDKELMLCLFLHGTMLLDKQIFGPCMQSLSQAADLADKLRDNFMLGQIYTNLHLLCSDVYNADATEYARKALEAYKKDGKPLYVMDGEVNLAISHYNIREYAASELLLDSALVRANALGDDFVAWKCIRYKMYIQVGRQEWSHAISSFQELKNIYKKRTCVEDYAHIAIAYAAMQQRDSAEYYLNWARKDNYKFVNNELLYLNSAQKVYELLGDYQHSVEFAQRYQIKRDSIYWTRLSNSVMREQRDFVQEKLTETEQTNDYLLFSIFGLAVLLAFVTLSLSYIRMRGLREQEKRIAAETELELKNQCIQNSIRGIKKSAIVEEFNNCLTNDHRPTQGEWNQLSDLFSEMLPNFEKRLRDAVDLREEEWNMCMLQKLDFKAKEIELLTGINPSVTSNRLAKKGINENFGATEWRQFLKEI